MSYIPGDSYTAEFTTENPTTGASQNADSTPVATPNHNGTDDGSFTLTVNNLDTGRYKVTGTIPSGYASGDRLNVTVAATVNGVPGKAVIDRQVLDGHRVSDLYAIISPWAALANAGTVTAVTAANSFTISLAGATLPASLPTANPPWLCFSAGADGSPISEKLPILSYTRQAGNTTAVVTFAGTGFSSAPSIGDAFELV